jgi:4-amino-4-deoxy-L-arabinose transferase-like glycosyltransferase
MQQPRSATIYRQLGLSAADRRIDWLWLLFWTIAAGLLYTWQLGDLPLIPGVEGVFQAAHPPLMPRLMALAHRMGGVNAGMTRLPSALLSAAAVPLLYWVGREMFYRRLPAIFATGVYLTMLPVLRQGRLAMPDGAMLCFLLLMWGCLLRSRRDLRWSLGIGGGIGLMSLTQGWRGGLLGAIALVFLLWDTPRLFRSFYLWLGWLLGAMPVVAWYIVQSAQSSRPLLQGAFPIGKPPQAVWFYLLEMLQYGGVWLLFVPLGLRLLGRDWHLSWARQLVVWFGGYFLIISLMPTKFPGYALPLYPPIALLCGVSLTDLWEPSPQRLAAGVRIPARWLWAIGLCGSMGIASGQLIHCWFKGNEADLVLVWGTLAATTAIAAITVLQQSRQFMLILIWGLYLTLFGFVSSDNWVGELTDRSGQTLMPYTRSVNFEPRQQQDYDQVCIRHRWCRF